VLEALSLMRLSRAFDDKGFALQRQGRFGTFSPVRGQEASVVGAAMALDPAHDWVVPQYRELPALLRQGLPLKTFMLYFTGHPAGGRIPDGVHLLPIQISLAAQMPQAVGSGLGTPAPGRHCARPLADRAPAPHHERGPRRGCLRSARHRRARPGSAGISIHPRRAT